MFCIWLFFGDRYLDTFLPEQPGYHCTIHLLTRQTGWKKDVQLAARWLDGKCFLKLPQGFACNGAADCEVLLDRHLVLRGDCGTIAVDMAHVDEILLSKYALEGAQVVTIGRDPSNALQCNTPLISASHGALLRAGNGWVFRENSHNGTYINHQRINNCERPLHPCDELFFAPGIKLVFLGDHIALSHVGLLESVKLTGWKRSQEIAPQEAPGVSAIMEVHRAPRIREQPDVEIVEIEPPITKAQPRDNSLLMTIGPSLTMVLPMVMGAIMASMVSNGSNFMLAGLAMIGTSSLLAVIWSMANFRRQKKQEAALEAKRKALYSAYLKDMEKKLRALSQKEYQRLLKHSPSFLQCVDLFNTSKLRLWERMPAHDDFLSIRLGLGQVALPNEIRISKQQLSLIDDEMRGEPQRLRSTYENIKDAPVCVDLRTQNVIGVLGNTSAQAIITSMIVQIAALQSYHDVKIVLLMDETHLDQWAWARWLPHAFPTEDRTLRMTVGAPSAIREVLAHLNELLQLRSSSDASGGHAQEQPHQTMPHYVVFCLLPSLLETDAVLNRLVCGVPGFTLVVAAPHMEQLPKECKLVLTAGKEHSGAFSATGDATSISFEKANFGDASRFAHQLAPLRVRDSVMGAAIPSIVSFLELYGIRDVSQLDVWRFWNERHAFDGLESIIGLRAGAQPFVLDISDKKHGPHGLVAGTTGSGKSVMLQTYILSLALRYHPKEVQFILIDYKGGGMSDSFQGLPHIAGTIDNLQGLRVIKRALASVQGEIRRREGIFKAYGVSNVDEYMRHYQLDPQMEPLSHLIIVVDEFAELKKEQPEFMRELISASRVGRSVGIHLILATQKPSNSVDDEIWSNARFRICLRVQNRSDSLDMLKRPDASYIKGMGRCFVQIGNDEIFEEVQTSWSGATYDPNHTTALEKPTLLNEAGQPVHVSLEKKEDRSSQTQMTAVMARIREVMAEHTVAQARRLWLDELPDRIDLMGIEPLCSSHWTNGSWPKSRGDVITAPIGLADDLQNQQRIPALLNLTQDRNHLIIGLSATGKSTLLQTLALSLCMRYAPDRVQLYVMALTSHTLGILKDLPHVGDIVFDTEPEDVLRLIHMLTQENERRRTLFAKASTDNFGAYQCSCATQATLERVPAIVILVDRIAQLLEIAKEDEPLQKLQKLFKEGSGRGIFFIATAMSINEVPLRMRESFCGVALQLHDRSDYLDVLGRRVPSDMSDIATYAGRGMIVLSDALYEMQTAVYQPDTTDAERALMIRALAVEMNARWQGKRPDTLPKIPADASWAQLAQWTAAVDASRRAILPVGYRHIDAQPALAELYSQYAWLVMGTRGSGKSNALLGIASALHTMGAQIHVLTSDTHNNAFHAVGAQMHPLADQPAYLKDLDTMILERNKRRKAIASQGEHALRALHKEFEPYVLLLDGLQETQVDARLKQRLAELATMATGYGLYLFVTLNVSDLALLRRDELLLAMASKQNGLALCKLTECDVWDIQLSYAVKNKPLPRWEGYWVNQGHVERLVIPKV